VSYQVLLHPKAKKSLDKLQKKIRDNIRDDIKTLENNPKKTGDKLSPTDFFRIRVGDYRAIFEVWEEEKKVVVLFIGYRSKVYTDFKRFM